MLDVVIGAILIITAIDVRGKYTLSRVVNQSGGTRPYVFDREALAYFLDLFTRGTLKLWRAPLPESLRCLFAGGFAPHKQSNVIQKMHRNMRS